jgi:tetratricopeptide (TPR) repeat protein
MYYNRVRTGVLGVTILGLCVCFGCKTQRLREKEKAEAHLGSGKVFQAASKHKEALAEFQQAIQRDSSLIEATLLAAQVKHAIGDYDGAIAGLQLVAVKKYKLDTTYLLLADAYFRKASRTVPSDENDYRATVMWCEKTIQLSPAYVEAYKLKTLAEFNLRDDARAMATVNTLVALDTIDIYFQVVRATLKARLGNTQSAQDDLSNIISMESQKEGPDKVGLSEAYRSRGSIYRKHGRLLDALADFTGAITLDSTDAMFYLGRGDVQLAMNHRHEACQDFTRAADLGEAVAYEYLKRFCGDVSTNNRTKAKTSATAQ